MTLGQDSRRKELGNNYIRLPVLLDETGIFVAKQ